MADQNNADQNNMDTAVDLRLLQDIRAEYETRAAAKGVALPAFDARGQTGHDLLLAYRNDLKDLPIRFSADKFGCDPCCVDGSCPPCFEWERIDYERFRLHLRLSNQTDPQLLQDIVAQYQRLAAVRGARNQNFTIPAFDPNQFEDRYDDVKLFRYLKTLAFHFSDKVGCDPHCPDGSCPPCFEWTRADYQAFLLRLRAL